MSNLIYRPIEKKDYPTIKRMINEAWHFDQMISNPKSLDICLSIYLQSCLCENTYSQVAEKDGHVIGVILGRADKKHRPLLAIPHHLRIFYEVLKLHFHSPQDKRLFEDLKKITAIYDELLAPRKQDFQGSITLFIVSSQSRGLGIGKTLVHNLFDYLRSQDISDLYLYTDTNCNYGFYDSQGFKRIDAKSASFTKQNQPFNLDIFLYAYHF